MLVHPWDAGLDEAEWQTWIAEGHDFGQLSVNGPPGHPPVVVPTHFTCDGHHLLIHLARPNPVWKAIEHDPNVVFTVIGDYAFVPGPWRAKAGTPPADGVPTGYRIRPQCSGLQAGGEADCPAERGRESRITPGDPASARLRPGGFAARCTAAGR